MKNKNLRLILSIVWGAFKNKNLIFLLSIASCYFVMIYANEKKYNSETNKIVMSESRYEYIVRIMPLVDDFAAKHCLDKWAVITQICHETDFGKSRLAKENHNLFGIRDGERYAYFDSREDCIRRWYQIVAYSGNKHYRRALGCLLDNDFQGYFEHISRGGWADDKRYAQKCSRLYKQIRGVS